MTHTRNEPDSSIKLSGSLCLLGCSRSVLNGFRSAQFALLNNYLYEHLAAIIFNDSTFNSGPAAAAPAAAPAPAG